MKDRQIRLEDPRKLGEYLKKHSVMFASPFEIQGVRKEERLQTALRNALLEQELQAVHALLEREKTPYIFIKGLATSRYYPRTMERPTSDIDIIIAPEERYRCLDAFLKAGYTFMDPTITLDEVMARFGEVELISPVSGKPVEIHWHIINSPTFNRAIPFDFDALLCRCRTESIAGCDVRLLPLEVDLAYQINLQREQPVAVVAGYSAYSQNGAGGSGKAAGSRPLAQCG